MPLFDFRCRGCGREFEALVRASDQTPPECPDCRDRDLEQLRSTFAVSSADKTRAAATVKRQREASVARQENVVKDAEAERHRLEDH